MLTRRRSTAGGLGDRSAPVLPGAAGEGGSTTAWTGEKRRKTKGPSPLGSSSFSDDADMMDVDEEQGGNGGGGEHPPVEEENEGEDSGPVVYSANDEFSLEELAPYMREIKSRPPPVLRTFEHHPLLSEEEVDKVLMRFYNLRFREYREGCITKKIPQKFDDFPDAVTVWDDPDHLFDWTVEYMHFDFAELNEYQRLLPAREDIDEYCWWDDYSSTLSTYETDVDYVMYCDALSRKIKWIEEYLHLDSKELLKFERRGFDQAMIIAAYFCHLPLDLAKRGYKEYILRLKHKFKLRDVDHLHFELWKGVTKKKMGFIEALREIHEANMYKTHASRIEAEIQGVRKDLQYLFKICKDNIPNHAVEDDEVLKNITFVVDNKLGAEKDFLDFTIKKLKIALRLQLTPSPCFTQELERLLHCKGEE